VEDQLFSCVACTQNFDSDENLSAHDQQFHPEVQMGAGKPPGPDQTPDDFQEPGTPGRVELDGQPDVPPQASQSGSGSNA
jgi:hypothetical protein